MTVAQPNFLKLAKEGNVEAIAALINRQLQPKGIIAKVALKGDCLQVILEAATVPHREVLVAFLTRGIISLRVESVKTVRIYGKQTGEDFPEWQEDFEIPTSIETIPPELKQAQINSESRDSESQMTHSETPELEKASNSGGSIWNALFGAVAGATEAVGHAASYAGGTIAGAAVGTAQAVGSAALHATDGVGYVVHMISDSPQLQELTKAVQVDWLLAIIDRVDIVKAKSRVNQLQQKYPDEKPGEISHRIMLEKALYVGGSGFASSLVPGFSAPLFAVDLAATTAMQAEMGYQIACAYGLNLNDPARKGEILGIFGLALGGRYAIKAGLGLVRNIPLAGAAIGASSNAAMLYAVGHAACHFYEAKLNPLTSATAAATSQADSEAFMKDALKQQVVMDQILVHVILAGHPGKTWQQILPELPKLNLSPTSIDVISANIKAPPSLEALLNLLNHDFAIPLVAQCHSIAQMDGVTTLEEAKVLKVIADRFSVDIASLQSQGAIAPHATGLPQKLFGLF